MVERCENFWSPTPDQLILLRDKALGLCEKEIARKYSTPNDKINRDKVNNALRRVHKDSQTKNTLQSIYRCLELGALSLEELTKGYDLSAVSNLPTEQRAAIHEKALSGDSNRLVAETLGCTKTSVKTNLAYATNKIQATNPQRRVTTITAVLLYRRYLQQTEIPIL